MKNIYILLVGLFFSFQLAAQNTIIQGTVTDKETGEPLIGANVLAKTGLGTVADFEGNYSFEIPNGTYTLQISYVGFVTQTKQINATGKTIYLDFNLETAIIDEVQIVADFAIDRETPIAFTNILPAKIEEELSSQDIPMVLNSTPGVYATQQGGGDGDARINIRGFDQKNIAVMLDGVPVNDMENGWVYWSNWFGLDAVSRNIQIQRGLSASKLALPSVGGTINILTQGIEAKEQFNFKHEAGSNGYNRTSLGYSSGKLKNDWSISLAGSYKKSDGNFEQAWSEGWFYYARIDKQIKKHILTFSVLGAPQRHGQRSYTSSIPTWDLDYAWELGAMDSTLLADYKEDGVALDKGLDYNANWGFLERWTYDENGDTVHADVNKVNTKINYYHKPQLSFKHFWTINDNTYLSNIAYASIGSGGGTGIANSTDPLDNQVDLQKAWNNQAVNSFNPDKITSTHIYSSINNHYWYGFLSTLNHKINDYFDFSGGIDLRSYKGEHYRELYDMLGGEVYYDTYKGKYVNNNNTADVERQRGDKIYYYNDALVRWGGLFSQAEYKKDNFSATLNLSVSTSGYQRIDHFAQKDLVLPDTTMSQVLGFKKIGTNKFVEDTVYYDGKAYTIHSPEARDAQSDWKWIPGYTVKMGANYNLSEHMNIFTNLGYLSKASRFDNVIGQDNQILDRIDNEKVSAIELGWAYRSPRFSSNVNLYYTDWQNKPTSSFKTYDTDNNSFSNYINGISALHKGVELDFIYKVRSDLDFEGLLSLGDWKWNSSGQVNTYSDGGVFLQSYEFDAKGIHVSDAAQTQVGASLRYEPFKGFYLKGKYTWFDRYYAYFNPENLRDLDEPVDSWQIPSYKIIDLHIGYKKKVNGMLVTWTFNFLNVFDELYISDAVNNNSYNPYISLGNDAMSASVFMGLGRRFTTSIKISI